MTAGEDNGRCVKNTIANCLHGVDNTCDQCLPMYVNSAAARTDCVAPTTVVPNCYYYRHDGIAQQCNSCDKGYVPGGTSATSYRGNVIASCVAPEVGRLALSNCEHHFASNLSGATFEISCNQCSTGYMVNQKVFPNLCFKWKPSSYGCLKGSLFNDNFEPICLLCDYRTHYMIEQGVCALKGTNAAILSLSSLLLGLLMLKL